MTTPPLSTPAFGLDLALANFAPVLFTALALLCVARLVRELSQADARMAWIGAALVVLAGLSKAAWKLILALGGPDLPWLANALFPLMAPGFALLACALWHAQRKTPARLSPWLLAPVLIGAGYAIALYRGFVLGLDRGWFLPLMILASVANLSLTLLLLREAWRRHALWLAPLFVANFAMVFALQRIARIEPKTLALHWLEQSLTAAGAGAFALGAWLLVRRLATVRGARLRPQHG